MNKQSGFKLNSHVKTTQCVGDISPRTIGRVIEILPENKYKCYFYKFKKTTVVPQECLEFHLTKNEYHRIMDPIDELGSMH